MKTARFATILTLAFAMLLGGSFAQTTQAPSAIPAGSVSSGYGPYDWQNQGNALKTYKMFCLEGQPGTGQDTCLFRDIAGHLQYWDGSGTLFRGALPIVAGTWDNIGVNALSITDGAFHALIVPFTITSVAAGGVYTGTITNGGANAYVGQYFNVAGFTNTGNNKVMAICTASTATTLTLAGATIAETASATAAADIALNASTLGVQGKTIRIHAAGVYTNAAASLLNAEVMLCQTSGCASGTVVAPVGCVIITTNQANNLTNGQFTIDCTLTATATVGASGTFWAKGSGCANLGATTAVVLSCFADLAVAASTAVDETKNEFVNIAFKFTSSNASNTATLQSATVEVLN